MNNKSRLRYVTAFLFIISIYFTVYAESDPPELGIYEHLDEYLPENIQLVDENYNTVNLKQKIDKPTVIALVYYECPGICSPLLEGVADVITKAKIDLGTEYQVFTISFDPDEKPKLAKDKKSNYAKLVKGKDVENGWTWFTGDSANITKLLNGLGYKVKKEGQEYIHPAAIMVVSPDSKITRYLHGTYFLPFDLKMAVIEASEGKSGPTINKVLKYCFSYDPEGQKYVMNFTKVSGSIIIFLALSLFVGLLISSKSRKRKSLKAN
ncbi:MAG: SCO family protein [Bacteroidales bacterium]